MPSMVPTSAVAVETRPPRFRWFKSSTVNQWQSRSTFSFSQARTSSKLFPCWRSLAACQTSSPSPIEAQRESKTSSRRLGNRFFSSFRAKTAL